MSSIVVAGDTSGSITLAAPAVAGTNTLTLPANTGTVITTASSGQSIPSAALPTGSVLQVVQSVYTTYSSTSSTSLTDTGLSASITPTSSTSKVLVLITINAINSSSPSYAYDFVLTNGSNTVIQKIINSNTQAHTSSGLIYLDSPATTSAYTYKVRYKTVTSGVVYLNNYNASNGDTASTITLMEIAA